MRLYHYNNLVKDSRINGSKEIPKEWLKQSEYSGGMLFNWGVYLIDQALLLIDDIVT